MLELEEQLSRMVAKVKALEQRATQLQHEIACLEDRRDEVRADVVRYEARPGSEIVRAADVRPAAPHDPGGSRLTGGCVRAAADSRRRLDHRMLDA